MINPGDEIFYFEYLDHGKTFQDPKRIMKNPMILFACGKVVEESEDFLAVLCSGTKNIYPSSQPSYEIIFKKAIIKKEMIYIVE